MKIISDVETPPGIAGVGPEPGFIFRNPGDPISLIVVLTKVQDPANLSGVIRTADYFGVDEVWLGSGSVDPFSPKCIRGAMGATFRMPVRKVEDLIGLIAEFKATGAEIWAAEAHSRESQILIASHGRRIILLGGESQGLDDIYLQIADKVITIKGSGRGESLNLAVAAGILIHDATAGHYKST
jgi:TrmH family RNA methyltransferase